MIGIRTIVFSGIEMNLVFLVLSVFTRTQARGRVKGPLEWLAG